MIIHGLLISGLVWSVLVAQPAVDVRPLPQGVSIHNLDNGLKVVLIENPALPMVGVNVVVKVGSAYETFATSGMSHMLEHLLFNGTNSRTQKQLYDDVDRIGGYNNANTSEFYTNFMMVTPAENILKGMEIQADMLFHSTLPEKKYNKEKGIVLEEISKTLADPGSQQERNILSVLYKGHALSLPTLGTYSTIEGMKRDDVYRFYKNNYVPNNMVMSVVGNFNSADMLKEIKKIYGAIPPGNVKRSETTGWSTGFDKSSWQPAGAGQVYHEFYGGNKNRLQLFYRLPGQHDAIFNDLLDVVLRQLKTGLQNQLGKKFDDRVEALSLSTYPSPLADYIQVDMVLAKTDHMDSIVQQVTAYLGHNSLALSGQRVAAEAAKARTAFLRNIEKPHMFGIFNADEFAVNGIEAVLAHYNPSKYVEAAGQLSRIHLKASPVILLQEPNPKASKSQKQRAIAPKLFKNIPGGPILIIARNPASHLIAIHYLIGHKASLQSKYGKDAAKILHDCVGQRLSSETLQAQSSRFGLKITVNDNPYIPMDDIYLNPDFGYIRVEGLAEYSDQIISFLNKQLTDFVPTESEFNKAVMKFKQLAPMMMGRNKAKKMFKKLYTNLIYQPQAYPTGPSPLTFDNLSKFSKIYFTPANMVISVVSPDSAQRIKKDFSAFVGPETHFTQGPYTESFTIPDKPVKIEKNGGGNRSYLFWGYTRQIDPEDKAALKALSLILSDKIVFDIREKQGMAYHMSAGIQLQDDKALFYIEQGTRPKNVDVLLPQYPRFFNRKILKGVTTDDLQKSVNMYLGRMMFRRLSSINRAYYLGYSYYFHDDIGYDQRFLDQLKKVKLSDVQRVARKYLKVKNPLQVIVR